MLKLTKRLQKIVDMADRAKTIADVGCDHGKAGAALLQAGKAGRILALDISGPSLQKARTLAEELGLSGKMECRQGNGLHPITPGEADAAILAGMGATLIIDILNAGKDKVEQMDYLLLSPNSMAERMRLFLSEDFEILDEALVKEDGHFYPVIKVAPKKGQINEFSLEELAFGPVLLRKKPPELKEYVEHKISLIQRAVEEMKNAGHDARDYETRLERYGEVLQWLTHADN